MVEPTGAKRRLAPGVRVLLFAFAGLTLLATNQLYVLARHTEDAFAWTIQPPITAAFLGGGFGAGFVLVVLSLRQGVWASARIGFLSVLLFTCLMLVATLLHLDRFHFGATDDVPSAAAWIWLVVYAVVPVAMLAVLVLQLRAPGSDPPVVARLGVGLRVVLGLQAVILLVAGVALFLVPASRDLWPWPLTPLTARAVASWLVALGLAAVLAIREEDLRRLRPAAASYVTLGVLQLAAVLRFRDEVDWTGGSAWFYVVVLFSMLVVGAVALLKATPATSKPSARSAAALAGEPGRGSVEALRDW